MHLLLEDGNCFITLLLVWLTPFNSGKIIVTHDLS